MAVLLLKAASRLGTCVMSCRFFQDVQQWSNCWQHYSVCSIHAVICHMQQVAAADKRGRQQEQLQHQHCALALAGRAWMTGHGSTGHLRAHCTVQ